ncbi:hypothetical protein JCM18899A_48010 [Nocardioides sp. AN3]
MRMSAGGVRRALVAGSRWWWTLGGMLGAACMTAGGFAYSRMPSGGHVGRLDVLRDLRALPSAQRWGVLLCLAGVILLTGAWLILGHAVRRRRADVVDVCRATLLWAVPLLFAPPLFSGDAWSYAADGFLTGHGLSPYVSPPAVLHGPIVQAVCLCWRHTPAPYGPVPLLWGGALSQVTSSPWLLMFGYRVLAVLGLGLLMVAVPRLARMAGRRPAPAAWLAVASPFVLADGIGGAHVDLLIAGVVCLALALTASRGWLTGALLVGVATAVKAPAAMAGLGVVLLAAPSGALMTRVRLSVRVGAVALATAVGIGVISGLGVGWTHTMHVALGLHTPLSLTYDGGRALRWAGHSDAASIADGVGVALLGLGCLWILLRTPVGERRVALGAAGLATLLTTVLSPVTNYWYYLWCLPLLACCDLPARARRCLIAAVAVLGVLSPLDPTLHVPGTWAIIMGSMAGAIAVAVVGDRLVPLGRTLLVAPRRLWEWLAARPGRSLLAGLLLAVALRLPFLAAPFGDDEGGYLYVAQHWPGPGHWLYGGQWVDRPPVLLLVFKLVVLLGASPVAMRLVGVTVAGGLTMGAWYAGRRLAGPDGGLAAALCAAALSSEPALDGNQLISDGVGAMFVMVSFALLLGALHRRRAEEPGRRGGWVPVVLAGLAGCAGVLAFLSKQSALVAMVVAAVVLLAQARRNALLLLSFTLGVALPLAATLAWAAAGPGVGVLLNAVYTFRVASVRVVTSSTSRAPAERVWPFFEIMALSGLGLCLAHVAYDQLTRRRSLRLLGVILVAVACLAAVIAASVNWYAYYWLAVVPLAAVGMALGFMPAERRWHARVAPRLVVGATVLVAAVHVVARMPVNVEEPAMARYVAASAQPHDTMTVVWGQANLLEDAGLRTPYPYSWSLPVRVEDPHLRLFARILAGPHAPTWLLEAGSINAWHLETPRVARLLTQRYHLAGVVCGHKILLLNGVHRSLGAGSEAALGGRC